VQPFLFQDSQASSIAHAGTVRLRKRLQGGISVGGSYTWSQSIDNASTIGGGTTVPAQNAFDLAAERGLSYFDQRHRFTGDYLIELPFGHDRRWLTGSGLLHDVLGDWQWSGDWTIASGFPFSPRILGNVENVSGGVNGTLRAQATGLPITVADPSVSRWFNTAAFTLPPSGVYGDAGRNSIEGPGSLLVDMALTKVVPLKENRTLEFRASASNVFNRPQFYGPNAVDGNVASETFGQIVRAGQESVSVLPEAAVTVRMALPFVLVNMIRSPTLTVVYAEALRLMQLVASKETVKVVPLIAKEPLGQPVVGGLAVGG